MLRCEKSSTGGSGCQLPKNGAAERELFLHRLRGIGDGDIDSARASVQIVVHEKSQPTISLRHHQRSVEQDALLHQLVDGFRLGISFDGLRDLTDHFFTFECSHGKVEAHVLGITTLLQSDPCGFHQEADTDLLSFYKLRTGILIRRGRRRGRGSDWRRNRFLNLTGGDHLEGGSVQSEHSGLKRIAERPSNLLLYA